MVLQCLAWIRELWIQRIISPTNEISSGVRHLPDNIVFDILTRLPSESVLKCRRVCKQWLTITSSSYFVRVHVKRAGPTLVVQHIVLPPTLKAADWRDCKIDLLVLDKPLKIERKFTNVPVRLKEYKSKLVGCCDELLVFQSNLLRSIYVCNMVTRKKVFIGPLKPGIIFAAIFFHPKARDYKLLFHKQISSNRQCEIFIYSTRSKSWRKVVATVAYRPKVEPNVVILEDTLHWKSDFENKYEILCCRNSIIMFNMDTHKFDYMPHPGRECQSPTDHKRINLLEMKGLLCCGVQKNGVRVSICVLEDRNNWSSWVWKYNIGLHLYAYKFRFASYFRVNKMISLWKIEENEVIVYWRYRGLFRCHLEHNTVKKLDFPTLHDNSICIGCFCIPRVLPL